jgi:hypothetical protein
LKWTVAEILSFGYLPFISGIFIPNHALTQFRCRHSLECMMYMTCTLSFLKVCRIVELPFAPMHTEHVHKYIVII